jgi:hypothetical protein
LHGLVKFSVVCLVKAVDRAGGWDAHVLVSVKNILWSDRALDPSARMLTSKNRRGTEGIKEQICQR